MSRPKRVTSAVERICHEEGVRRVLFRSNKEVARDIKERLGIDLTPQYIGKLIATEMQRYRNNIRVRMFHGEQSETEESSRTIKG